MRRRKEDSMALKRKVEVREPIKRGETTTEAVGGQHEHVMVLAGPYISPGCAKGKHRLRAEEVHVCKECGAVFAK